MSVPVHTPRENYADPFPNRGQQGFKGPRGPLGLKGQSVAFGPQGPIWCLWALRTHLRPLGLKGPKGLKGPIFFVAYELGYFR